LSTDRGIYTTGHGPPELSALARFKGALQSGASAQPRLCFKMDEGAFNTTLMASGCISSVGAAVLVGNGTALN